MWDLVGIYRRNIGWNLKELHANTLAGEFDEIAA
jgi:hypothetical protein